MKKIFLLLILCYSLLNAGYTAEAFPRFWKSGTNLYTTSYNPTYSGTTLVTSGLSGGNVYNYPRCTKSYSSKMRVAWNWDRSTCLYTIGTVVQSNFVCDSPNILNPDSGNCDLPTPTCLSGEVIYANQCYPIGSTNADCPVGQELASSGTVDSVGNNIGTCATSCVPLVLSAPSSTNWVDLEKNTEALCLADLEHYEIDGGFIQSDDGCGGQVSACYGDPNSACWDVADIKDIIGDSDFVYKGLVSNNFECQADGEEYMVAFTEETNPDCKRVNDLYCFKLPFNKNDSNSTYSPPPPTNADDLNVSSRVPDSDIKTLSDNPALYISSVDKTLGEISRDSRSFYRNSLGKLVEIKDSINNQTNTLNSSLQDIKNADKSQDILDYMTQDVQSDIDTIKSNSDDENNPTTALSEITNKVSSVVGTYNSNYIGSISTCGSFYLANQTFDILGGSSSFDMSALNNLMNSSSMNNLFLLLKIFLYFTMAMSAFKIFVKVG